MSWLDNFNDALENYSSATSQISDVGEVNEITPDAQKKKRNKQLIVSIVIIGLIISSIYYFKNKTKK